MSTEAGAPLANLVIGPLGINWDEASNTLRIFRVDSRAFPTAVFRLYQSPLVVEVSLIVAAERVIAEKIIGRATKAELESFSRPISDAVKQRIQTPRLITRASLEEKGYAIRWTKDNDWQQIVAQLKDERGQIHLTMDALASTLPEALAGSCYPPELLDTLATRPTSPDDMFLAFRDGEDLSDAYWLRRGVSGEWIGYPYFTLPAESHPALKAHILAETRRAPRIAYFVHLLTKRLGLNEWMDMELIREVYDASTAFVEASPYRKVAVSHHRQAFDIEHFYSIGMMAAAEGSRVLAPEDLNTFVIQLKESVVGRLVENAEIAIGRFKRRLADAMYAAKVSKETYDQVQAAHPARPKDCLQAFVVAGVIDQSMKKTINDVLDVPTQLRHMWTHRGRVIDARFFSDLGKKTETLDSFGRKIQVRIGEIFSPSPEDIKWFSCMMTGLVDDLCERFTSMTFQVQPPDESR